MSGCHSRDVFSGALGKMRLTPERNELARSVLDRSRENNFHYRMIIFGSEIEWEMFSE
jgi:hypothetical protein